MPKQYNYTKKTGRPSKIYKALDNINLDKIKFLAEQAYTDKELGDIFGVPEQTINNWKGQFPQFFEALKSGKLLADKKVEASLYQRACGYSHPEIDIKMYKGKIIKTTVIKHYPPDATSMIFWLKNRQPEKWRDVHNIDLKMKEYLHPELKDVPTNRLLEVLDVSAPED